MYLQLALGLFLSAQVAAPGSITVELKPTTKNVDQMLKKGRPLAVKLASEPPTGVTALTGTARYGAFTFDGDSYPIAVAAEQNGPWVFYVDANRNGQFESTEKQPTVVQQTPMPGKDGKMVGVPTHVTSVELKRTLDGQELPFSLLLAIAEPTTGVNAPTDVAFVIRQYARTGTAKLDQRDVILMLDDPSVSGSYEYSGAGKSAIDLYVDGSGDGVIATDLDRVDLSNGFKFDNAQYRVASINHSGTKMVLVPAEGTQVIYDVAKGAKIAPFTVPMSDGNRLRFPDDFKGQKVIFLVWATWAPSSPQIQRMVFIAEQYKHASVVAINLDTEKHQKDALNKAKMDLSDSKLVLISSPGVLQLVRVLHIARPNTMLVVDGDTGTVLMNRSESLFKTCGDWIPKLFEAKTP